MAHVELLCDAGPLVAFFNRTDQYHVWARERFEQIFHPLRTCEAVLSEALFLLQSDGLSAGPLFEAISRGKLRVSFAARDHWPNLQRLIKRYENLPMSLADACLVRMSELEPGLRVFTTDRDFQIYRRNERLVIPLLSPFS